MSQYQSRFILDFGKNIGMEIRAIQFLWTCAIFSCKPAQNATPGKGGLHQATPEPGIDINMIGNALETIAFLENGAAIDAFDTTGQCPIYFTAVFGIENFQVILKE
ncbi:hypothetical protein B0T11DRAFT_292403 [Plectosphaerella cucumerina]|uniref:Ankyrin repeat domain-containing protein n=1 Tax=Plectosphaerella cucumerina TaxID=40658 RepID=A0A8K0TTY1_9PEZI|nr:hypothetical protein B0T11DRAFT_292403 [Plectosphaerella cucumerina]